MIIFYIALTIIGLVFTTIIGVTIISTLQAVAKQDRRIQRQIDRRASKTFRG